MLNSDHKPIARAPASRGTEKSTSRADDKINIFSQASVTSSKNDSLEKFDNRKRGPMSSAPSASTVAQSQNTQISHSTANQSVISKASRKRGKPETATDVKVGVKRKSPLSIGKFTLMWVKSARLAFLLPLTSPARLNPMIPKINNW